MHLSKIQTAVRGKNLQAERRCAQIFIIALALLSVGFATLRNHGARDLFSPPPPPPKAAFVDRHHLSVVVALHPGCACSSATIGELARIYHRVPEEIQITALILKHGTDDVSWTRPNDLATLANVKARILIDTNGLLARRLGMAVSGQLHIYSPNGKLLYNGGITRGSGEIGDNLGEQSVMEIIHGSLARSESYPAYGCSLFDTPFKLEQAEGLQTAARF